MPKLPGNEFASIFAGQYSTITPMTTLYIKNMVCNRCKMVVREVLEKNGLPVVSVELGEAVVGSDIGAEDKNRINTALESLGFEIIDDRKSRLIEQIKKLIIELVHQQQNEIRINLSDYLSEKLSHDYNYISNLFSEVEGTTIEKYYIAQKIERVKELLVYDELTLSEIAYQLNYSSVAHLSNQFKKVTGLTPSYFKKFKSGKRKPLDEI